MKGWDQSDLSTDFRGVPDAFIDHFVLVDAVGVTEALSPMGSWSESGRFHRVNSMSVAKGVWDEIRSPRWRPVSKFGQGDELRIEKSLKPRWGNTQAVINDLMDFFYHRSRQAGEKAKSFSRLRIPR
jgi:hypothetical protein